MIKIHTIPLSKAETRLLNQLARRDFEAQMKTTVENQLGTDAKAFHITQLFNHYNLLAHAMGWPGSELQSTYRNIPTLVVEHLLGLIHGCHAETFGENEFREFTATAAGLTDKLQKALGIEDIAVGDVPTPTAI